MVDFTPHITGQYNLLYTLYTLNNQGFSLLICSLKCKSLYIFIYFFSEAHDPSLLPILGHT